MSTLRRSMDLSIVQDIYYAEFPLSETPYIATVDADDEFITICNPRSTELHLKDYYVVDRKRLHKFIFTDDEHIIQPHGTLYLYTCPKLTIEQGKTFLDPHVLWRNVDGTLRRKEVLNNDHCEMLLYAPNHKCIASCSSDRFGRHEIKRREEELHSLPSLTFDPTTRTILSFLRILVLVAFAICALEHHPYRIYLYWGAFFLDVLSRERSNSSSDPGEPPATKSPLLRSLNCYGDDINLFILYTTAIMYYDAAAFGYAASSVLHPHSQQQSLPHSPLSTAQSAMSSSGFIPFVSSLLFSSPSNAPGEEGTNLNSMTLSSSVFQFFHTQSHPSVVEHGDTGIAWFRIWLILTALLEFTAITASTDQLHWRRDEDMLYRWVRLNVHPVCVTAILLGSEVYLMTYVNEGVSWHWAPWLVAMCFLLRVANNVSVLFSIFTSASGK